MTGPRRLPKRSLCLVHFVGLLLLWSSPGVAAESVCYPPPHRHSAAPPSLPDFSWQSIGAVVALMGLAATLRKRQGAALVLGFALFLSGHHHPAPSLVLGGHEVPLCCAAAQSVESPVTTAAPALVAVLLPAPTLVPGGREARPSLASIRAPPLCLV